MSSIETLSPGVAQSGVADQYADGVAAQNWLLYIGEQENRTTNYKNFLIKLLKVKWTLVVSILCYSSYIAAQFYPEFYTLLPTAFILGMGAAPLWSAKCTYLTQVLRIETEVLHPPSPRFRYC